MVYKYKMYLDLKNINEASEGLLTNIKSCILPHTEILFVTGNANNFLFFEKMLV